MTEWASGAKLWVPTVGLLVYFLLCYVLEIYLFVWAIFSGTWKIKNKTKFCEKYRQLILITKCSHPLLCRYFSQTNCFTITSYNFPTLDHVIFGLTILLLGQLVPIYLNLHIPNRSCQMSLFMKTSFIKTLRSEILWLTSYIFTIHYHVVILHCSSKQTLILCPFSTSLFFYSHQ